MSLSLSKPFSQCSLSDLAPAISADATTASARALDPTTVDRLLPVLRNDALTAAVLLCHPLVRDDSGLKCDGSACSKRAWCDMLRDLADAAGVDVSDAALLRVYLVCKECAKLERAQLCRSPLASDCADGGPLAAPPASVSLAVRRRRKRGGALAAPPAPAAAPRSASSAVAPPLTSAARRRGSPLTFKYHDRFLDKAMHIPIVWLHQIVAPLMLVKAGLHFAHSRAAAGAAPQHPAPPVGCMIVQLWPTQRTRFMFGFTLKACDRASTAPASSHMFLRTLSRWRTRILQRVMAGYVCKVEQTRADYQAAAASRVAGKHNVMLAATRGDTSLVADHVLAQLECLNKKHYEMSPLHCSSQGGCLETCRFLVEMKADVHAKDNYYGKSPLEFAIARNKSDVAAYLRSVGTRK